jgi:hypothetical protein
VFLASRLPGGSVPGPAASNVTTSAIPGLSLELATLFKRE